MWTSKIMKLTEQDNNRVFISDNLRGRLVETKPASCISLHIKNGNEIRDYSSVESIGLNNENNCITICAINSQVPYEFFNTDTSFVTISVGDNIILNSELRFHEILFEKAPSVEGDKWKITFKFENVNPIYKLGDSK